LEATLLSLAREALGLVLLVSAPPLLAALVTGVAVGTLQAATQIQEPSVAVVPRLVAALGALAVAGPWVGARLCRFAVACLDLAARSAP
jgi:flagellar biosynthesis protein FliQ